MEKIIVSMVESDYERLIMLSKSPSTDEEYTSFRTLLSVAKNYQVAGDVRVLEWNGLIWNDTDGSRFIEGFLSFCTAYRFIRIDMDEGELLQDAGGWANPEAVEKSVSIRVDVKINM